MSAWFVVLGVVFLAIVYVFYNYFRIRKMGEGTHEMIEMAEIIRSGAATFLKTEYKTISIVVRSGCAGFFACLLKGRAALRS